MANSVESILPAHIRKVFEQFGVIKPAAWPKLDTLVKNITGRKYRYDIQTDQIGNCTARVMAHGRTWTAVDGEPERALAHAFHECLKETGSAQLGMFDDDEADPENEAPDRFRERSMDDVGYRVDHSPAPPSGHDRFVRTNARTADGQIIRFDELTGVLLNEDDEILDIDPVEAARIQAELHRSRG